MRLNLNNNTEEKWDILIKQVRQDLMETDWTQLPDVTLTVEKVEAYRDYRSTLRDIQNKKGSISTSAVEYPIRPS
jgi:hypothetical protein